MTKPFCLLGLLILHLCLCSLVSAQSIPQPKEPNPFGQPTTLQMKQIENVLRRFHSIDLVGGSQQRAVKKLGAVIVPYLVDELEIRRERIYYDPLVGENTDTNEMVIRKVTSALESFARRDESVVHYLASRLTEESTFRCVKLIEILEEVAVDGLPRSSELPTIRTAFESATKDKRVKVVHAAKRALENIETAEKRFKSGAESGSIVFPATKLSENHPVIRLLKSATHTASYITKNSSRDRVYAQISNSLLEYGEIPAAIAITDRIANKHSRQDVQRRIATQAAAMGDVRRAVALSVGHYWQDDVLKSLAITLSQAERSKEIEPVLAKLKYAHQRDEIYKAITNDQLTRGNVEAALATVEHIAADYSRLDHLISLISLAGSLGNRSASEAIARKSLTEASRVPRSSTRALELIEVAETTRLGGLTALSERAFTDAMAVALTEITTRDDWTFANVKIAYEAASRGEYDIAKRLAARIERELPGYDNVALRSSYRAAVAVSRIESGQMIDKERRKILSLSPSPLVHEHLIRLARWDAARGDLDAAFVVVERIRETATPILADHLGGKAIVQIVSERLRVGDYDGAIKASTKWPTQDLPGMRSIITQMIKTTKFDLAADLASRFERHTKYIAKALADVDALQEALHAAAAIRSKPGVAHIRIGGRISPTEWGDTRGDVHAKIAIAALKRGQAELVEKALNEVQYPLTRGLLLCDLADTERERGNPRAGMPWIDEAQELVASVTLETSRARLQSRIVEKLVAMGHLEEANEISQSARNENVTRVHSVALAEAGRYERALELAESIESPSVRAMAITEMAAKLFGAEQ